MVFRQGLNLALYNMWIVTNADEPTIDSDDISTEFHRNTSISFGDERRGGTLERLSTH